MESRHRLVAALTVLLASLPPACNPAEPEAGGSNVSASDVERDLLDLIAALTPLPPEAPAGDQSDWHIRRRQTLERLRQASHAHGLEALRLWRERAGSLPEVLAGLLDVAAHTAPLETRELLVELVLEYGHDPLLRRKAAEFLAETSPETAIEILEPILRGEIHGRTFPPDEALLEAWNRAALATAHERAPLLCAVATDLNREQAVRHLATRLLGEVASPQGRAALEQLLVESSGNHMIRRIAAQSLLKTLPREELCALMRSVLEKEVDHNFQIFLDDLLIANCR